MTLVDVRPAIFNLLVANSAINALVTSGGISRIFPTVLPQGITADSIIYTRITEFEHLNMQSESGLVNARYQIDAASLSANRATELANLVKETLQGYAGTVAVGADHVDIELIEMVNARDDYDGTTQMHRSSKDYYVFYREQN